MRKLLSLLLILSFVACKKKDLPATTGTLSGTISPAGAALEVYLVNSEQSLRAEPDAGGRFTFKDLKPGSYTVNFNTANSFVAPDPFPTSITAGKDQALGSISFLDRSKTGTISGTIEPFEAATSVTAIPENSPAGFPEAYATVNPFTGVFEFLRILPGKYTLRFGNALGFAAEPLKSVSVTVDQRTTVGPVAFRNSATGSISGTVTPAAEVLQIWANYVGVYTKMYTVKPEADGKFKLSNISPGDYYVAATANTGSSFYAPYSRFYSVAEGKDTNIGAITLTTTPPPMPITCTINNVLSEARTVNATLSPNRLVISTSFNGLSFWLTLNDFTETAGKTYTSANGSLTGMGQPKKNNQTGGLANIGYDKLWYGEANIRITAIDPVTKTISGTFSSTLSENKDNSDKKTVTNGVFTNLQYR